MVKRAGDCPVQIMARAAGLGSASLKIRDIEPTIVTRIKTPHPPGRFVPPLSGASSVRVVPDDAEEAPAPGPDTARLISQHVPPVKNCSFKDRLRFSREFPHTLRRDCAALRALDFPLYFFVFPFVFPFAICIAFGVPLYFLYISPLRFLRRAARVGLSFVFPLYIIL